MCKILVIIGHEINKTVQLLGAPPPDPHFFGGLRPPHPPPGALPLDPAGGKPPDPLCPPNLYKLTTPLIRAVSSLPLILLFTPVNAF